MRKILGGAPRESAQPPSAMNRVKDAAALFPGVYGRRVILSHLEWEWGDLPLDRMAFLCLLAARARELIFEFGTFRGRTTLNLALNSPAQKIVTVDLGHSVNEGSRGGYGSYTPGEFFLSADDKEIRDRIELLLGDSTQLDLSRFRRQAELVFVDGGHSYEVCKKDSLNALQMVKAGGVVVWDDYDDTWPGVKKALDELAASTKLHLLSETGLVVYLQES